MKNTMVYRAMKTAFRTCPTDCIIMFIVQFLIVSIPIGGLYMLRWLVDSLMDKSNSFFFYSYCLLLPSDLGTKDIARLVSSLLFVIL